MAEERAERRLAAIMAADVVGYSRLMGADEAGTLAALKQLRSDLIDPVIAQYKGHIVKLMGDGALVEFASAVDAVECAVDIQRKMANRNSGQPEDRQIPLRIGVNIGDIIIDGDDIYGDGVNVAARLEGEAEAGGICVSSDAYRQVAGKIDCAFEDLGELTLKNIISPVRAYQVLLDEARSSTTDALKLPDKPSIAVLPFQNMSGDPEQEYFVDGIAEDIITALSRFHWFFVIARNSSFSYKGTSPDVRQVAKDLGVQYVLEGSVRKGGNRVRITAQLVDALTGRHVWADRYDRDLEDIFAVQDEISEAITTTVAPAFVSAEALRIERKAPENFDAWDYCMRGNWHLSRGGKNDVAEAQRLFETALELDPKNTMALSGFAMTAIYQTSFGWAADVEKVRAASHAAARRAVELDENDAWAHVALGWSSFFMHRLDTAVAECRRALELNPNLAAAETWLAIALSWQGEYDEAVRHAEEATRLSPRDPHSLGSLAREVAEFGAGRYEQAVEWGKKTTEVNPDIPAGWRYLAASLAHLGRLEEARAAKDELLRVSPHDNLSHIRAAFPSDQADRIDRWIDGLRKAGLPEE